MLWTEISKTEFPIVSSVENLLVLLIIPRGWRVALVWEMMGWLAHWTSMLENLFCLELIVNCGSPWGSSSWQRFGNRWNRAAGNFAFFWTHQTAPGPLCQHGPCPLSSVNYRASILRRATRRGREVWWHHGRSTWRGQGRGDWTVRV